jgi:hypothetical protein
MEGGCRILLHRQIEAEASSFVRWQRQVGHERRYRFVLVTLLVA